MRQLLLPYPMVLQVDCRTSRDASGRVVEHPVTLHPDGTVETPHDLESERIAVALGGYLTCLDLVDRGFPALEAWIRLALRADPLPVRALDVGGPWSPRITATCCNRHGYQRPEVAFAHARSPGHVAQVFRVDDGLLRQLVEAAQVPEPRPPRGEPEASLWRCGLAPDLVGRIRAAVGVTHITSSDVLCLVGLSDDLEWLDDERAARDRRLRRALARLRGDEVQLELLHVDPQVARRWAVSSAPRWAVQVLLPAGYAPEDVEVIAEAWGVSHATAALALTGWVGNGLRVDVVALTGPRFRHLPMPPGPPSPHALDRLRVLLGPPSAVVPLPSETELALLLVEHGTVADAAAAIRAATP